MNAVEEMRRMIDKGIDDMDITHGYARDLQNAMSDIETDTDALRSAHAAMVDCHNAALAWEARLRQFLTIHAKWLSKMGYHDAADKARAVLAEDTKL